ncbi:MAG: hypothetical protein LBG77_06990 [Dysgonamonadaceae bacterium]|nr:hypothetical protein [Dysgonamonadaceae bacterium]
MLLLIIGLMQLATLVQAQEYSDEYVGDDEVVETQVQDNRLLKNTSIGVGFMMGGGSLVGADLEYLFPNSRFGLQIGLGISSFGGAINYHLKDGINSPFISFQYLHQGFGDNHYASWLGPIFIWRFEKLLQIGIGLGSRVETGPLWKQLDEQQQKVTASLLYSIGLFF